MIRRILAVCQGPNDVGFLRGLRERLGCPADLINAFDLPILRQRETITKRSDARAIWDECQRLGADLIVRITDADGKAVQDVVKHERYRFPSQAQSALICGACDRSIEHWLALDIAYAAASLGFHQEDYPSDKRGQSGFIKERLRSTRQSQESYADRVERFVREAPPATMRIWLDDPGFCQFYDDCRRIAAQHQCEVTNERDRGT